MWKTTYRPGNTWTANFGKLGDCLGAKKSRITCHIVTLTPGHPLLVIAWKGYQAKQTCGVGQYCLSRSACSRRVAQGQDGCKPLSQHSASTSPSAVPELWDFSPDSPAAQVWRLSEPAETHLSVVCLHNTLHKRRLWSTTEVKHTVVINTT